MFSVKTFNNIAKVGIEQFDVTRYSVSPDIENPQAILLRSHDLHEVDLPSSVIVVARAGAGTNNIPIDKMTKLGIPVLNTPGANANAVKELVITGMLLAARNIFPAWDYLRQLSGDDESLHQQIEKNKKQFAGFELPGKTLGVIGLGNIGVKVANAASYLDMNVIGYDPSITVRNAWELSSEVKQAESIEELLLQSDFVTLHIPLNEQTTNLINNRRLHLMKQGSILLNLARDGIVENDALLNALNEKHIRHYVCDFPSRIFKGHSQVISLPHLGASTEEAEQNCAVMAVQQIKDFLENGHIKNSVNFPNVQMQRTAGTRLSIVNANVPNMVAQISSALSQIKANIIDMINKSREDIAYTLIDINVMLDDATLKKIKDIHGVIRVRQIS